MHKKKDKLHNSPYNLGVVLNQTLDFDKFQLKPHIN